MLPEEVIGKAVIGGKNRVIIEIDQEHFITRDAGVNWIKRNTNYLPWEQQTAQETVSQTTLYEN